MLNPNHTERQWYDTPMQCIQGQSSIICHFTAQPCIVKSKLPPLIVVDRVVTIKLNLNNLVENSPEVAKQWY